MLFLLGLVGLWTVQANSLTRELQENLDIIVELEEQRPATAVDAISLHLRSARYAQPATPPRYQPKEIALEEMGPELAGDLEDLGLNNPLLDVITFNVPSAYLQADSLAAIAAEVQGLPGVAGVYYQENFVERIARNARRLSIFLIALAVLFTLVAAVLIHNTVRLSLYANRFLIKTQELVGASWGFISRPFLLRSLWQGAISGLLAAGAVVGVHYFLRFTLPELNLLGDPLWLLYGGLGLMALGMLVNFLSHYVVVRRYLRLRLDELY